MESQQVHLDLQRQFSNQMTLQSQKSQPIYPQSPHGDHSNADAHVITDPSPTNIIGQPQQKLQFKIDIDTEVKNVREMRNNVDLDYEGVFLWLELLQKCYQEKQDYPTELICRFLFEYVKIFKKMGSALGAAFSDCTSKIATLREHIQLYDSPYFFQTVQKEISLNIHELNGDNNKKQKAPEQYKKYISSSRQMLRMLRFIDFLYEMFELVVTKQEASVSDCIKKGYELTLEQHHAWIVKKGAKAAMGLAPKREKFIYIIVEKEKSKEDAYNIMKKMNELMDPVRKGLWDYYKNNKLDNLP